MMMLIEASRDGSELAALSCRRSHLQKEFDRLSRSRNLTKNLNKMGTLKNLNFQKTVKNLNFSK